jgi:hypothetical protein
MVEMAVMLRSTRIQQYTNRMILRQNSFETSTECSLARVWVNIVSTASEDIVSTPLADIMSTPSEDIVLTPSEELASTPSEQFGSTSASPG